MQIKVKLINKGITLPSYAHNGDAGLDLRSAIDITISPGERCLIPTGIAIAIPEGYAGFVQPRSGLAIKHGIALVNSPGLIDSEYRGEIKVIVLNTDKTNPFKICQNDKIAQLVIQRVEKAELEITDELDETKRGDGGFGSTGTN